LTVDRIIAHAARWHGEREVVSRSVEGPVVRTSYGAIQDRAKRLSNALLALGVVHGDRVATLAWNTARHVEVWYAVMGMGAVCHTINPRLFDEQLRYIINHAEDRIIFADLTFAKWLADNRAHLPSVEYIVLMTDADHMAGCGLAGALCYETLLADHAPDAVWGAFDETTACGLCYTSGTTGAPKGVLYSHRSNFLHTFASLQAGTFGLSALDVVLPIVPMFHANAWGTGFSVPAAGAKLVLPGPKLDGASVHGLLESEGVTCSLAVPTVWHGLLHYLRSSGARLSTLKRVIIGGSACPPSLIDAFQDGYGVEVAHGWGMTETSPLGALSSSTPPLLALEPDEQRCRRAKQGRAFLGIEMRIADEADEALPHDGHSFGRLQVRGPFVAAAYFKEAAPTALPGGFFDTGDIATIDRYGFMQITDRAKDIIKSGGEWISSVAIENIVTGHAKVALAAVVGVAHPQWEERPLLLVKLHEGEQATKEEFLTYLQGRIAKWWIPDEVVFVRDLPLGATGKIDKKAIREQLKRGSCA
jgi:fatty-acyl-CoA synthase